MIRLTTLHLRFVCFIKNSSMKKKILHLINDYNQSVYTKFLKNLDNEYENEVFIFNKNHSKFEVKFPNKTYHYFVNIFFYTLLRIFIPYKNLIVSKKLKKVIKDSKYHLIHAHTLFSSGGSARKLKKQVKYVVTVRSSDINYIWKFFPWLRSYGRKILTDSAKVICLSPWQKNKILGFFPDSQKKKIEKKIVVIPSGIDDFWFQDQSEYQEGAKKNTLLFVGELAPNKNVHMLIHVQSVLQKRNINYDLKIIGGSNEKYINRLYVYLLKLYVKIKKINVFFIGEVPDKAILKRFYQSAKIFIMLSKKETFGLTYIESISQGTPIIYVENQGIDGLIKDGEVGLRVSHNNTEKIIQSIIKINENYNDLHKACLVEKDNYSWYKIIILYYNLYSKILK